MKRGIPRVTVNKILAAALIVGGIVANPWVIGVVFTPFGPITKVDQVFLIGVFEVICLVVGVYLWFFRGTLWEFSKPIIINTSIVIGALMLCLGGLELVLRTGWFDNLDNPHPVWIPARFVEQNEQINNLNFGFSGNNPYTFNDILRTKDKKSGRYRIAILGDSFVWGDGLPYDDAWGHIMERRMRALYDHVEVISWGKAGWSTKRELRFLKEEGHTFSPDLLIIGFVFNDLDSGTPQEVFTWQKVPPFNVISILLPNAFGFVSNYLNAVVSATLLPTFSNELWVKSLYDDAHKEAYRVTLRELRAFCAEHNIRLLVVLTPPNSEPIYANYHTQVTTLLSEEGIEYLDLYPTVAETFAASSTRSLWANPANAHPGKAVTSLYASEVIGYITSHAKHFAFPLK